MCKERWTSGLRRSRRHRLWPLSPSSDVHKEVRQVEEEWKKKMVPLHVQKDEALTSHDINETFKRGSSKREDLASKGR